MNILLRLASCPVCLRVLVFCFFFLWYQVSQLQQVSSSTIHLVVCAFVTIVRGLSYIGIINKQGAHKGIEVSYAWSLVNLCMVV
jgi:hypothetical protein